MKTPHMNPISGTLDRTTGSLTLHEIDCVIHPNLTQSNFLTRFRSYLLYHDTDFFTRYGFFHFCMPVKIWKHDFRLSVFFLAQPSNTSDYCTGYGLHVFNYEGEAEDQSIAALFAELLNDALGICSTTPSYSEATIWRPTWGIVRLGAVIQNGTEPEVSVGWNTKIAGNEYLPSTPPTPSRHG